MTTQATPSRCPTEWCARPVGHSGEHSVIDLRTDSPLAVERGLRDALAAANNRADAANDRASRLQAELDGMRDQVATLLSALGVAEAQRDLNHACFKLMQSAHHQDYKGFNKACDNLFALVRGESEGGVS